MVGSGMGLFLIMAHWFKILPPNLQRSQLNVCIVYGVPLSPLQLKLVQDWLAISVST
jgi:hypothetical protein